MKLTGIQELMKKLNQSKVELEKESLKGMIVFAGRVRRGMEKTPPLVPIDDGNLRASWFTTSTLGTIENAKFVGEESGKLSVKHAAAVAEQNQKVKAKSYPAVTMGFSAYYGPFVHENTTAQFFGRGGKKPGRPNSGAKFFESSLNREAPKYLKTIAKEIKI